MKYWEPIMFVNKQNNVVFLLALFGCLALSGCTDQEEVKKRQAAQAAYDKKVEEEKAEKQRSDLLVENSCKSDVENMTIGGRRVRILDWVGHNESNVTGYVIPTATGYKYEIGAKISGHTSTMAVVCYTDRTRNVIDLQIRWIY